VKRESRRNFSQISSQFQVQQQLLPRASLVYREGLGTVVVGVGAGIWEQQQRQNELDTQAAGDAPLHTLSSTYTTRAHARTRECKCIISLTESYTPSLRCKNLKASRFQLRFEPRSIEIQDSNLDALRFIHFCIIFRGQRIQPLLKIHSASSEALHAPTLSSKVFIHVRMHSNATHVSGWVKHT
jgi:hypothetical protein